MTLASALAIDSILNFPETSGSEGYMKILVFSGINSPQSILFI